MGLSKSQIARMEKMSRRHFKPRRTFRPAPALPRADYFQPKPDPKPVAPEIPAGDQIREIAHLAKISGISFKAAHRAFFQRLGYRVT